jgi:predicted N-formylglutamate amidohydrolase
MSLEHATDRSQTPARPGWEANLLAPDESPPFEQINLDGTGAAVLVCDHASNRIPRALGDLGLGPEHLARHIAWDPGAAAVARGLCARLDAPLILAGWSRLVIDPNRPLASPESIPEVSDDVRIPGNLGLSAAARALRVSALFDPYHRAVAALLDARASKPIMLLSIHSFTPVLGDEARPWHAGVACGADRRLADPLIRALRCDDQLCIGDNEPYDVDHRYDYTLPIHAETRGIRHAMIEIRQDQLESATGIDAWVARLASTIRAVT